MNCLRGLNYFKTREISALSAETKAEALPLRSGIRNATIDIHIRMIVRYDTLHLSALNSQHWIFLHIATQAHKYE